MARGVQEGDRAAVDLHGIGADVLGDAAGLAAGDVGLTDRIQQTGLAMVDVTHDNHDRAAGLQLLGGVGVIVDQTLLDGHSGLVLDLAAHLHGDQCGGIVVDDLTDGGHDAQLDQLLDHLRAGLLHTAGQLAHGNFVRDMDGQRGFLGDLQLQAAHLLMLLVAGLGALEAALLFLVLALGLLAAADALLAAGDVLHALRDQLIHMIVEAVGVDVGRGGIDHAALALALGLLLLRRLLRSGLGLFGSRRRRRILTGLRLRLWLLSLLGPVLGFFLLGLVLRLALGFLLLRLDRRLSGLRLRLALLRRGVHLLDGFDLVLLRQHVKDQIQLFLRQHLLMALGLAVFLRHQLHDNFVGHAKILGNLTDSVFL